MIHHKSTFPVAGYVAAMLLIRLTSLSASPNNFRKRLSPLSKLSLLRWIMEQFSDAFDSKLLSVGFRNMHISNHGNRFVSRLKVLQNTGP
jgi:hypothetical protein